MFDDTELPEGAAPPPPPMFYRAHVVGLQDNGRDWALIVDIDVGFNTLLRNRVLAPTEPCDFADAEPLLRLRCDFQDRNSHDHRWACEPHTVRLRVDEDDVVFVHDGVRWCAYQFGYAGEEHAPDRPRYGFF